VKLFFPSLLLSYLLTAAAALSHVASHSLFVSFPKAPAAVPDDEEHPDAHVGHRYRCHESVCQPKSD
jgi:hypothetical protein